MKHPKVLAPQWHDCGELKKTMPGQEFRVLMTLLSKKTELRECKQMGHSCVDLLLRSPTSRAGLWHRLGLSAYLCWVLQTTTRMIFLKCKFEPDILLLENPY